MRLPGRLRAADSADNILKRLKAVRTLVDQRRGEPDEKGTKWEPPELDI